MLEPCLLRPGWYWDSYTLDQKGSRTYCPLPGGEPEREFLEKCDLECQRVPGRNVHSTWIICRFRNQDEEILYKLAWG